MLNISFAHMVIFDHIGAVKEIKEETGALILLHEKDLEIYKKSPEVAVQLFGIAIDPQPEPDRLIQDGENINLMMQYYRLFILQGILLEVSVFI